MMNSAIYTGTLQHRRTSPRVHDFKYGIAMFYLDLAEIPRIFRWPLLLSDRGRKLAGFDRRNYLPGGAEDLAQAVRDLVLDRSGLQVKGPIRMLTQISYFGFCFNPVTFFYCFDEAGTELECIVAEITNTPWNERRTYVLPCKAGTVAQRFEFQKDFHISPFMPMDLIFKWKFSQPRPERTERHLAVRMENWHTESGEMIFEANLLLTPKPMTAANLVWTVVSYPLLTLKAFVAIYFQALVLLLKRIQFHPHPTKGVKS